MKKYIVLGAGLMGRVAAKNLLETESDARVTLTDIDASNLQEAAEFIAQERLTIRQFDVADLDESVSNFSEHDVSICALPHRWSLPCIKAAIRAGISCVDMVGEAPGERQALDREAKGSGTTIIPGFGVAPGLSNVCVGRGVELLDETIEAVIYVGGIPVEKTPPLDYQTVYCLESVFEACLRPAVIFRGGKEIEVEALSGLEYVDFSEPIGRLEAFYTDGIASLSLTMKDKVADHLAEKTLRYPGFTGRMKFLRACGLLDSSPVRVGDAEVDPMDLLIQLLTPHLKLGPEGDLLVMRVVVKGLKNGDECTEVFELIDKFDPETRYTAMARTTCFPAVIAARMLANGSIAERGVRFPEQIFTGDRYHRLMSELEEQGIVITHHKC
jgi:lysine 6-dehydrogenase